MHVFDGQTDRSRQKDRMHSQSHGKILLVYYYKLLWTIVVRSVCDCCVVVLHQVTPKRATWRTCYRWLVKSAKPSSHSSQSWQTMNRNRTKIKEPAHRSHQTQTTSSNSVAFVTWTVYDHVDNSVPCTQTRLHLYRSKKNEV